MNIKAYQTRKLIAPRDDLLQAIRACVKKIPENSVVAITSKVVSIWEGRCVLQSSISKIGLIKKEADKYLRFEFRKGQFANYTVKNNLLVMAAGVDKSIATGYYILWPKNPNLSAKRLCLWLKKTYKIKKLGVIITDSRSTILRRGVIGHGIGYFGFIPLKDYRPKKDSYGTQGNIVDALAAAAVVVMGEGSERTPLALMTDVPFIDFSTKSFKPKKAFSKLEIPLDQDFYFSLIKNLPWKSKR